jgi:hypothetical protein
MVAKLQAEISFTTAEDLILEKIKGIHSQTMTFLELDDLVLQMKLSLEDKEALVSSAAKLNSLIDNEEGSLGSLS